MSSRLLRYLHEQLSQLDLALIGRFARREEDRALAMQQTQRHLYGPIDSVATDNLDNTALTPYVLQGLEVSVGSGSGSVTVTAGALVCTTQNQASENRPGTWGGKIESDDYPYGMHVLPAQVSVSPAVPISVGAPTVGIEWWLVYLIPTAANVENNTAVPVLNVVTGAYVNQSFPKVEQHQVTVGVVRGSPGGNKPAVPTFMLATGSLQPCPVIATLQVPSGASDLRGAYVYDERRLPIQNGLPNEIVDGAWQCPINGQAVAPYSAIAWVGSVTARIQGELVSVRSQGLTLPQILDPVGGWTSSATPTNPKIAYLYLCRVKGRVPRLRRIGSNVFGSTFAPTEQTMLEGALVLSAAPPLFGSVSSAGVGSTQSGFRWDLRPNQIFNLPAAYGGGVVTDPNDAVCIGVMIFTGYDSVNKVPLIYGPILGDRDGWFRGEGISLVSGPTYYALNSTPATTASISHPLLTLSATLNAPTGGSGVFATLFGSAAGQNAIQYAAIDEVELSAEYSVVGTLASGTFQSSVQWQNTLAGVYEFMPAAAYSAGPNYNASIVRIARASMPIPAAALWGVQGAPTSSVHLALTQVLATAVVSQTLRVSLVGIRWPWRTPLVT